MSFVERQLNVSIQLPSQSADGSTSSGSSTFGGGAGDTLNATGLRVHADIESVIGPAWGRADIRIYGLTKTVMNTLATPVAPLAGSSGALVTLSAGDDQSGMSVAWTGRALWLFEDFSEAPDVCMSINGQVGVNDALNPVPPVSYNGPADVVNILQSLASQMNRTFENNGVSGIVLASPYFAGTLADQARSAANAAGINLLLDGDGENAVLAIWPQGGSRDGEIPLISPSTGLVGYPQFQASGITLRTLYNPSLRIGGQIQVQSSLQPACGTWQVIRLSHRLKSQTPDGEWFSDVFAANPSPTG